MWDSGYRSPEYYAAISRRRSLARRQVRAKFPALIEGSSGWNRAFENRFKRIKAGEV